MRVIVTVWPSLIVAGSVSNRSRVYLIGYFGCYGSIPIMLTNSFAVGAAYQGIYEYAIRGV